MATCRDETDRPFQGRSTFSGSGWRQSGEGTASASDNPLVSRLAESLASAWRRGEHTPAEVFLEKCPGILAEEAVRLIYEEICLREEAGEEVDTAEFLERFPSWRAELDVLFRFHRVLVPSSPRTTFPDVGEELLGFRLLSQLGQGALGKVFLASQPSLADRLVVLKVSPRGHEEHLSLARLQHMHIVPIYSEQVIAERNLSVICMPYMGGATLAQVIDRLARLPNADRTGRDLLGVIDQTQPVPPVRLPAHGPFREYLERRGYVQAVCWIAACLADALQYAHDRGLVHMDVKPSNVLIAADGQPMLLDFHLAREPIRPDVPFVGRVGGTSGFMAPEHHVAMEAVRASRPVTTLVDGRADVYSLGVLIHKMLGGASSDPSESRSQALHRINPRVSIGLSDIVGKCLRSQPSQRYASAAFLAADLRRHLNDLPLMGVPNRSLLERWSKWRRRRPQALSKNMMLAAATVLALIAGTILAAAYRQRVREMETALSDGRGFRNRRQYSEASRVLHRGLELAGNTPAVSGLRRSFESELAEVSRDQHAEEFHRIVDLIRFRFGTDPKTSDEIRSFVDRAATIWKTRERLIPPKAAEGEQESETNRQIRDDLLDFAVIWADLRARLAPDAEREAARRDALQILAEAEALLGPSPTLDRYRHEYARSSDRVETTPATSDEARSAWEHFDLGRFLIRSGELERAADHFQKALEIRPQDFWTNFFQGLCAYRRNRFEDAVGAFRVCIALAPESAECYYNRGLAHESLHQWDQALSDYSRALALNANLTQAALNRGVLLSKRGRHAEAAAGLNQALKITANEELLGRIHLELARVHLSQGDRPTALENLKIAAGHHSAEARELLERLVKEEK